MLFLIFCVVNTSVYVCKDEYFSHVFLRLSFYHIQNENILFICERYLGLVCWGGALTKFGSLASPFVGSSGGSKENPPRPTVVISRCSVYVTLRLPNALCTSSDLFLFFPLVPIHIILF